MSFIQYIIKYIIINKVLYFLSCVLIKKKLTVSSLFGLKAKTS